MVDCNTLSCDLSEYVLRLCKDKKFYSHKVKSASSKTKQDQGEDITLLIGKRGASMHMARKHPHDKRKRATQGCIPRRPGGVLHHQAQQPACFVLLEALFTLCE